MNKRKTKTVRNLTWNTGTQQFLDRPETDPEFPPKPAGWRILVRPLQIEARTGGGIILTDKTKDDAQFSVTCARIISLGPEAFKREDMDGPWAEVGDYIIYAKYGGFTMNYGGVHLVVLNDDGVIAVIPEPQLLYATEGVDKS